jgi:4a-hydroxytetrahydrobiopterin dehydratase
MLEDSEIESAVAGSSWTRREGKLVATLQRADFAAAIELVNQIAELAEKANHHPDIHISWNKVTLELWTHSSGGITQADLDLAAGIDALDLGVA